MPSEDFFRVVGVIRSAKDFRSIFGLSGSDAKQDTDLIKIEFRRLVKHVHPDTIRDPGYRDIADDVYRQLNVFRDQALVAVAQGNATANPVQLSFSTSTGYHEVSCEYNEFADMADCYKARSVIGRLSQPSFIKVARTPRDNDLLAAEASAVALLRTEGDANRFMYYPELIDTFAVESGGKRLRANAFTWLEGLINLESVKQVYPTGVDPLDAAWMWRRVLWSLANAHNVGLLHGAVVPRNVLIHPVQHGVVLADWCYSSIRQDKRFRPLRAVVGKYRSWYTPEALDKQPLVEAMDIALGARTFIDLLGGDPVRLTVPSSVPKMYGDYFIRIAQLGNDPMLHVPDAGIEFDEVLQALGSPYYPRRYRAFSL